MGNIINGSGRIPLGVANFRKICGSGYCYVDKTLLIRDLLDSGAEATLFTRPRRFGKSLNMDMLRVFFESAREDTSWCFRDKKIWKCGPKYTDMQGKHPVIHISFAQVSGHSWESLYGAIMSRVRRECRRQLALMGDSLPGGWDLDRMNDLAKGDLTASQARDALVDLTEILHRHHGAPVVILVDEYDTPIESAWERGNIALYNQTVEFMRNLMATALKDNEHLAFACLTGVLRVAKEGLFSGLNHLRVNGVLNEKYDEYFGFTPDEVRELAAARRPGREEETYGEFAHWYEGYRFGSQEVFNPWSVLNYFEEGCKARTYWSNTSGRGALGEVLLRGEAGLLKGLRAMLNGGTAWSEVDESLVYPDLAGGSRMEIDRAAWTLLLMSGYVTATGNTRRQGRRQEWELAIPNEELMGVYEAEILDATSRGFDENLRQRVWDAIESGHGEDLEEALTEFLLQSASFFDLADENSYQMWLLGLLTSIPAYRVTGNREAGKGRYDICLAPTVRRRPGVIIEIKVPKRGGKATPERLDALAAEALGQIDKRKYVAELHAQQVREILKIGMAFHSKDVRVKAVWASQSGEKDK